MALLCVVSVSVLTAACSSGSFEVAAGEDATAVADEGLSADTNVEAATTDSEATPEDVADTSSADTADTAAIDGSSPETSAVVDAKDTAVAEVTEGVDSSTADARDAADACVANACGGCAVLAHASNAVCGECGGGTWQCDGTDAMKCVAPKPRNSCGGCATLAHPKDEICGKCSSGKYVCAADGESTSCSDPVPAGSPIVGTACGTCGTKTYVCNVGKTDTVCSGDDANACGGCGDLAGVPDTACGACGKWTCATNKSSVSCVEATPIVNTSCGTCGSSKYICTALATSACQTPDDRTTQADFATATLPVSNYYLAARATDIGQPTFGAGTKTGASFKVGHTGSIARVWVGLARGAYTCGGGLACPSDAACVCESNCLGCAVPAGQLSAGKIYLDIYAGALPTPGTTPLATASVNGDDPAFVDGVGSMVQFDVVLSRTFDAGDVVSFILRTDSTKYTFAALTGPRPGSNPERQLRGWKFGAAWEPQTVGQEDFLTMTLDMNACF